MNDLKFACRQLLKNPGFTAVALLTLALGIGANTAAFSWIQTVLLRTIPGVAQPKQLVVVAPRFISGELNDTMSYVDLRDFANNKKIFADVIGSQFTPMSMTLKDTPEWVWGQIVTANFFDVLGVQPILGRTFSAEEERAPGAHPVVVLSYGFWQRRFQADTNVIGRTINLNRHPFTVIGVAPADFQGTMGGLAFDLWAPVMMQGQLMPSGSNPALFQLRGYRWLHTIGRLAPGISLAKAQAAVTATARNWEAEFPNSNRNLGFVLLPLWKSPWGAQHVLLPLLTVMFAVSFLVLIIVAANIANLLLARATSRDREIAVRLAIGAGRLRLIRQLLTESIVLSVAGGIVAVPCALWLTELTARLFPKFYLPVVLNPHLDVRGLLFMLIVSVSVGMLFGLAPAWQFSRMDLAATLKDGTRSVLSGRHWLRSALAASEIALALLLLISAGLCLQSFRQARTMSRGFDPSNILLANLRLGVHGYDAPRGRLFYRTLLEQLRELPGVQQVSLGDHVPLGPEGGSSTRISVEGYAPRPNEQMSFDFNTVSPGYFTTLRIPLVDGRDFQPRDDVSAPGVVVVNETLARRFWSGLNPIGRRMTIFGDRLVTVIGVVKDIKHRRLNEPAAGYFYVPLEQNYTPNMNIHLRTAGNPLALVNAIERQVKALDPGVQPAVTAAMDQITDFAVLTYRIAAAVLMVLALTALLLAIIGIYGVVAFTVSQRTQEIGIRMALGAARLDVIKMVLGEGTRLAACGVAVGLLGALAATRVLSSLLVGISALDPLTFAVGALLLASVALLACYVPARRAAKVDPMVALRYE